MTHQRFSRWGLVLSLMAGLSGCGDDNPLKRQPISGTVTLGSQPLKEGSISFQPEASNGVSSGGLIQDGKYALPVAQGLPDGKYRVLISAASAVARRSPDKPPGPEDVAPPPPDLIPPEFNTKSDKFVTVTAKGPNQFNFEIPAKK